MMTALVAAIGHLASTVAAEPGTAMKLWMDLTGVLVPFAALLAILVVVVEWRRSRTAPYWTMFRLVTLFAAMSLQHQGHKVQNEPHSQAF